MPRLRTNSLLGEEGILVIRLEVGDKIGIYSRWGDVCRLGGWDLGVVLNCPGPGPKDGAD